MVHDQDLIDRIRGFNRFYTNIIGLLDQHFLDSPFSLTEGRVLYEICNTEDCSAKKIRGNIVIDEGYLSRILDGFVKRGLIEKTPSPEDGRLRIIGPTEKGIREFSNLNDYSNKLISRLIERLSAEERADLLNKMEGIRALLESSGENNVSLNDISIRTKLKPGDIGYVIKMHGTLYKREYGYGIQFETYVAKGLCEFYEKYKPKRNRVWICEHKERMIGFLLLMDRGKAAQLRYFLIEPEYRGLGLGSKLLNLYMDFLHQCGYKRSYLWTTHELTAAASLYKRFGFKLTKEKESTAFGKPLREQRYDLILP